MPDAMLKIRSELGSDAVILSTKEMKIGGFLGMFQKKKIEVIAASETSEAVPPTKSKTQATPIVHAPVARGTAPQAYRKTAQLLAGKEAEEEKVKISQNASSGSIVQETTAKEQSKDAAIEALKQNMLALASTNNFPAQNTNEESTSNNEVRLFEELHQMKLMMTKLARQQDQTREFPEALVELQDLLLKQDITTELIDQWMEPVYESWLTSNKTLSDQEMRQAVMKQVSTFLQGVIGEGIRSTTKIVYVAGPTGVGKTTTIAKLAADQIFRERKQVGFITADTYRISAIEQLRTYATILNVPLEVVQSPGDMHRALNALSACDLIFMDTAGRNYLNELFVAELHSLFNLSEHSETYLVLSLTSKTKDMQKITEHFSKYGLQKVIFTKLDETESVGPLYNLLNEYPLKVSYITNGQNVPDDILPVDDKLMLQMLMEGRS
jgi:flagellar biosynthesis protein FlhF